MESVIAPRVGPLPGGESRESGEVLFQVLAVMFARDVRRELASAGGEALRLLAVAGNEVRTREGLVRVREIPVLDRRPASHQSMQRWAW